MAPKILNSKMCTTTEKQKMNLLPILDVETQNNIQQPIQVRPQLPAVVAAREQLSTARIRLTFSGNDVATFIRNEAAQSPGSWVKLFVPSSNGEIVGRAYTLRKFDLGKGTFDVDFFTHKNGPASSWANSAQVGDTLTFAGPRDGGFSLDPISEWLALIGDETCLSAIQVILSNLPSALPGIVLIEVDDPDEHKPFFVDQNMKLQWIKRTHSPLGADGPILKSLDNITRPQGRGQVWVAGESNSVKAISTFLQEKWKLDKESIRTKGYWKKGVAHFRS
ncbi:MAG: siderophore-interacting protein [Undibacterium sp.]|uniref:siderophore-interacting protein n=1 Tax=Undibacterium sp. TaxID=1914977 RepID=UPI00271F3F2F|nr:siderophore-interacting protein [Undibacterium sp.]MDO8651310.1 siderophore-interacting protein [Undibacterium sp.]